MMHTTCGGIVSSDFARALEGIDEDRRYFLEVAVGLWLHTREQRGKPTRDEARATLEATLLWNDRERELIMDSLVAGGEVA